MLLERVRVSLCLAYNRYESLVLSLCDQTKAIEIANHRNQSKPNQFNMKQQ